MTFCSKEKQLIDSGFTAVDNRFIIHYLADAPEKCAAVYLIGLALANGLETDNCCEFIANRLNITCEEVMNAFEYWDELGLIHIVRDTPPSIIYLEMRSSASALKKINVNKYKKFSINMQDAISGRMITTHEFNEYYVFLENSVFEPDALVAVAKYCVELKGKDIGYRYILTVAKNQLARKAYTLASVSERLNSQQKYDEDLKIVFKVLETNRSFEHDDRELYEKWTKELGYTLDTITAVAKKCKKGGMTKLDSLLTEYYTRNAMSEKEIEAYETKKEYLYELARKINRAIGVYYQSLDAIVDEYITKWDYQGYDDETLLAVAKYCFTSGIRTLNGLASVIDKLYKNGVTSLPTLQTYLARLALNDERIQRVLTKCGLDRRTTSSDRQLFKTWTEAWAMPQDVIEYVAEKAAGTNTPMAYVNRILSDYKQHGVFDLAAAEQYKPQGNAQATTATTAYIGGRDMERRQYTDEEISALFTALDEEEN